MCLSAVGADPALILRLKELELELQQQLNRALEIEAEKAVKLRQLELEEGNARQPVQETSSVLRVLLFEHLTVRAFESIKALLCSSAVLSAPNFALLFKLDVDASATDAGAGRQFGN
ncbi:hypothetical protein MHYP_G00362840 [Metynnis hypsauchen]